MQRIGMALAIVLAAATAAAEKHPRPSPPPAAHAGVDARVFHPAALRNWRGASKQELDVTVWYPASSSAVEVPQLIGPPDAPLFTAGTASPHADFAPSLRPFPLIVLSHGTGGSAEQMAWLGSALARAGYIVAAVNHPGNNSHASVTSEGFVLWWERATDLSEVIDGMLADEVFGPRIDKQRIGAAGFSIGGYTVMELAGARTDVSVLYDACRKQADQPVCQVPEMKGMGTPEEILARARKTSGVSLAASSESYRDPRVKAVFAIAPAVAMVFTQESLREIRLPIEIAVGAADPIAPPDENADYIRANVRGARENVIRGAAHYTFLDSCTAAGKQTLPVYCSDGPGVDRDKVHDEVTTEALGFFDWALKVK